MNKRDYFSEFEYIPTEYALADEIQKQKHLRDMEKMKEIGNGKVFNPYNKNCVDVSKSYEYIPSPFDALKNDTLREKCIHQSKILAGPFIPTGREKIEDKPTRALFGDIMTKVYKEVQNDWPECSPTVLSTEEDFIVIYFDISSDPELQHALVPYMNVFINSNRMYFYQQ